MVVAQEVTLNEVLAQRPGASGCSFFPHYGQHVSPGVVFVVPHEAELLPLRRVPVEHLEEEAVRIPRCMRPRCTPMYTQCFY